MFAEAQGLSGAAGGKFSQPVVLPALQRKGPCGKEASLLKALFVLLVLQTANAS
jgi:hypothetical protein